MLRISRLDNFASISNGWLYLACAVGIFGLFYDAETKQAGAWGWTGPVIFGALAVWCSLYEGLVTLRTRRVRKQLFPASFINSSKGFIHTLAPETVIDLTILNRRAVHRPCGRVRVYRQSLHPGLLTLLRAVPLLMILPVVAQRYHWFNLIAVAILIIAAVNVLWPMIRRSEYSIVQGRLELCRRLVVLKHLKPFCSSIDLSDARLIVNLRRRAMELRDGSGTSIQVPYELIRGGWALVEELTAACAGRTHLRY